MSDRGARLRDGNELVGPFGPLNPEQVAAVADRERPLLLEASAGAGKTLVLVERFVRDVLEGDGEGGPLECDEILTITFTRKAAAELRGRIRRRFAALAASDIPEAPRARAAVAGLDGAWISTIDAFCARVLRRHALVAGVDPAFEVADEADLAGYRRRAFGAAVEELLAGPFQERLLDLLAAERYDDLVREISGTYERLRSAGQAEPRLPKAAPGDDPDGWIELLDALLAEYGAAFAREKRSHGGCDFADVLFGTLGLLADNPAIAAEYRDRFRRVLVDEFQDTNGLQLALFEALGAPARFQVGDPLQSIYGFRDANVELFRAVAEAHEEDGRRLQLVRNYRSRPEILEAVNAGFSEAHVQSGFEWTEIVSGHEDPAVAPWGGGAGKEPFVELLFTDKLLWDESELETATAEARLVANRVKRLIDEGEAGSGEVVILFETRTAMADFRQELRRLGIEAVSDGGDRWWSRGELADLLVHARLLANRRDEEQLLGALRSPACAVSIETLALLGAQKRLPGTSTLFDAFENACAEGQEAGTPVAAIADEERERLRSYMELFRGWASSAGGLGAGELLDRIATDSACQSMLLQEEGGRLALANVRKLIAIAHSWDGRDGGGIRAFLDWADTAAPVSKETDAPVGGAIDLDGNDDPAGPVRLMTIHAAKGLEFPVVVVARLGSGTKRDDAMLRVDGDRVGCELRAAGEGGRKGIVGPYAALKAEAEARTGHERRRKFHVAVTRAERRLILSGAARASEPWDLDEISATSAPLKWVVPALLGPDAAGILESGEDGVLPVGGLEGAPPIKLVISSPEQAAVLLGAPEAQDGLKPGEAEPLKMPAPGSAAASRVPPTVSYSQLSSYSDCAYRWYLEKVVGLPARNGDGRGPGTGRARARGSVAHLLLELLSFEDPEELPDEERIRAVAASVEGASAGRDAVAEQRKMLERFAASGTWKEIAACTGIEKESSFAIEVVPGDASLPVLTGAIDLIATRPGGRVLVVDYKTNRLDPEGDEELGEIVEESYALQRDAYALVALRRGAQEVEVSYCFLERPDEPVSTLFSADDEEELAARLAAAARELADNEYPVSARPRAGLCAGCPGRPQEGVPGLCEYTVEETLRQA